MKKTIFLAIIFYVPFFYSMGIEHDLYKSFLTTKIYMSLYVDVCQKASLNDENKEIEKYLNRSLKSFLSKSLPDIKNKLVVDHVHNFFEQSGWRAVQECSQRIERTEKSMLFIVSYDQQTIEKLVSEVTKDFKRNLDLVAKKDKREDVAHFVLLNL